MEYSVVSMRANTKEIVMAKSVDYGMLVCIEFEDTRGHIRLTYFSDASGDTEEELYAAHISRVFSVAAHEVCDDMTIGECMAYLPAWTLDDLNCGYGHQLAEVDLVVGMDVDTVHQKLDSAGYEMYSN